MAILELVFSPGVAVAFRHYFSTFIEELDPNKGFELSVDQVMEYCRQAEGWVG
jgi:hypothetical protein